MTLTSVAPDSLIALIVLVNISILLSESGMYRSSANRPLPLHILYPCSSHFCESLPLRSSRLPCPRPPWRCAHCPHPRSGRTVCKCRRRGGPCASGDALTRPQTCSVWQAGILGVYNTIISISTMHGPSSSYGGMGCHSPPPPSHPINLHYAASRRRHVGRSCMPCRRNSPHATAGCREARRRLSGGAPPAHPAQRGHQMWD